LILHKLNLLIN